jgi:hypothetical protein
MFNEFNQKVITDCCNKLQQDSTKILRKITNSQRWFNISNLMDQTLDYIVRSTKVNFSLMFCIWNLFWIRGSASFKLGGQVWGNHGQEADPCFSNIWKFSVSSYQHIVFHLDDRTHAVKSEPANQKHLFWLAHHIDQNLTPRHQGTALPQLEIDQRCKMLLQMMLM